MKIESIRLKNFKSFQNAELQDIPKFCVFVGANASGKSTIFGIFGFLKEALNSNIKTALMKLGGSRGFQEVRSRNSDGPIEIEIKFRINPDGPVVTYLLQLNEENGESIVEREILRYRRGSHGKPWHFLDFAKGEGYAVTNEPAEVTDVNQLERENQKLKSPDILALKGIKQFERFRAAAVLGDLIENWHISDFHINRARPEQDAGYAEHLSREGENLSLVIQYLHQHYQETFNKIIELIKTRVPGITNVESKNNRGRTGVAEVSRRLLRRPVFGPLRV